MARKSVPARRPRASSARPVYHEVQPGGTTRGNPQHEPQMRGEAQGLGWIGWSCIAIIALLLIDAFVWQGYYAHQLWASINARGTTGRDWSNNLWR